MATKTIADIDLSDRTVLMRVDFNVPLDDDQNVTDERRIVAALPSIKTVLDAGGRLVLMSHLGRPKGEVTSEFSLKPAAETLGEHLGKEVKLGPADPVAGDEAREMVADLQAGDVLCLENVRFDQREDTKDNISQVEALGREMADLGADVYVNDAFGTCHRKHASMWGCPKAMKAVGKPAVAGLLVEKEIKYLHEAVSDPKRPFVAILGGAKVSDKIKLIDSLLGKCDKILIGGAMAYTLLEAAGHSIGTSLCEEDQLETMKALLDRAGEKIVLPVDHVCADDFKSDDAKAVDTVDIPDGLMGMDIGTQSINLYEEIIKNAGTVVWNGPMGVFERKAYADGTKAVAEAIANATAGGTVSVIGGGDSASAVETFGLAETMTHVSTGGGASLTYLEGKPMPPIEILDEQ
ncbi:MAG: phosphoglycerate kinase [Planctomycetes bacterium]|jgi:phosphoglycerate kinase|nr:phosphoglycerate kinase [Phycisphaerae bacterium]NBB94868.1 phosphoglycerate kinase [Planctomycetota bacterium]